MLTDLTELEQQVVDAARRGDIVETAVTVVAELAVTNDPGLRIRAELLRDLLRGLHGDLDPRGIRVRGVRVVEELRRRDHDALGNRLARWRHWLWGWLGHYGYRAHRLVLALGVVLALAAGLPTPRAGRRQ